MCLGGVIVFLWHYFKIISIKSRYALLLQQAEMQADNEKLTDKFSKELKDTSEAIINRFYEKTENHFQIKTEAIDKLMNPVQKILSDFQKDILNFRTVQAEEHGSLKSQITRLLEAEQKLEQETRNLTDIIKCPGTRGLWGEMQLKRVLELSGMLKHCDFNLQEQVQSTKARPDVIIKLPDDKIIIVDAKSPLSESYFSESIDKSDLIIKIRDHIKCLKQKAYWENQYSPEFVILFLPGESLFNDAIKEDPSLIDFGHRCNVFLTSPVTLLAMLKTISFAWKQENMHKQIEKIGDWGKTLYSRLITMFDHFNKVGHSLNTAVNAYNDTLSSLEKRVMVTAREFDKFDVKDDTKKLGDPKYVEVLSRTTDFRKTKESEEKNADYCSPLQSNKSED